MFSLQSITGVIKSAFLTALTLLLTSVIFSGAIAAEPVIPRGKGEFCVEPTDVMRKDHMKFLLHQRDATVYDGVRTKKHSLNECVTCHVQSNTQGDFIPVNAPDQFCESCHTFASVKLDCFECHATTPDSEHSALRELLPSKSMLNVMAFRQKLEGRSTYHAVDDPSLSEDLIGILKE